jgi:hypothetical protein
LVRPRSVGEIEGGGIGVGGDLAVREKAEPFELDDADYVAGNVADLDGRDRRRALDPPAGPEVLRLSECRRHQTDPGQGDHAP